jgi:hypothetical protein
MTTEEIEEKLIDIDAKLTALMNDYALLKHDLKEPQSADYEIIRYIESQASIIKKGL